MNVRPAGREACNCASPYNSILERLDAMEAEILAVQATANSAMGVANAQAGAAASSASAAAASATAAGNAAISAAADASDALTQATASAGSADDAADSAADALTALQTIEGTIASVLASDIGGKVDKLTTAGFYLYMHNGSTQGEVQPVVAPTAATIPIRDSDGRMQAADPASGATDKTLVTANWVSQTGAGAPNNLLHTNGTESKSGPLTLLSQIRLPCIFDNKQSQNIETTSTWRRVYHNNITPANQMLVLLVTPQKPAISGDEYGLLMIGGTANNNPICKWMLKGSGITDSNFVATYDSVNGFELWVKNVSANQGLAFIRLNETNWGSGANNWTADQSTINASFDYTTYPYYTVSS